MSCCSPIPSTPAPAPRREARVTIAAINGADVTLSKRLDFAHPAITDPNGAVVLRPRVANLTRNIVVRSEEQLGPGVTRGHTVDIGMAAKWDIRYNQFVGLGRTLDVPLDDTVLGTHIGTNQRGKYAEHHHHAQSSVGSADVGNTYLGNRTTTKWALVVHGTSDALVEENIAVDFPGAGFVTEDGYEVRNVFRRNLAAYIGGDPKYALGLPGSEQCERQLSWLRGIRILVPGRDEHVRPERGVEQLQRHQSVQSAAGRWPVSQRAWSDAGHGNTTITSRSRSR